VTALYTAMGNSRLLTVSGTANGNLGQYTVSWTKGADCVGIDGEVTSPGNGAARYTFRSFQVCKTGCPRSGTVTREDVSLVSVTTTYSGAPTVSFTRSNGETGTAILSCR
jgi:hypothetical protein